MWRLTLRASSTRAALLRPDLRFILGTAEVNTHNTVSSKLIARALHFTPSCPGRQGRSTHDT